MDKEYSLNIKEIPYSYEYDVITCYEHPIIAAIEFYRQGMGRYYALLSKYYGTYYSGNVREKVKLKSEEILGFELQELKRWNDKILADCINQGIPFIAGVNLKDIFYSSYYMEEDWMHWMLIMGYRRNGGLAVVLDNTQYEYIGHPYGKFRLPFSVLQKANKSYQRKYGKRYSLMAVIHKYDKNYRDIFCSVMKEYISLDLKDIKNYRQLSLLNMYFQEKRASGTDRYLWPELRNKLININKYRSLFFSEIETEMQNFHYPQQQIKEYHSKVQELDRNWQEYTLVSLVKANGNKQKEWGLHQEIVKSECSVQKEICSFLEYLEAEHSEYRNEAYLTEYDLENNEDNIIQISKSEDGGKVIRFSFNGKRIYNWWDMDDAPKVIISQFNANESGTCFFKAIAKVPSEKSLMNYEAGIFIRNSDTKESIMLGIENGTYLVADEIGVTGHKFTIQPETEYPLFISADSEKIEFGMICGNMKKVYYVHEGFEKVQIGLVCKTWGIAGNTVVEFIL